jgi:thymidylate synthase ThyX
MTPASRPSLSAWLTGDPDVVVPPVVAASPAAKAVFDEAIERAWEGATRVLALTGSREWASYLLPNATAIRFTESADLPALRHKLAMRLCWNAQEEIWRASVDEAEQVRAVEPRIGRWLDAPCGHRSRAGVKPICPEGERFCGVLVWRQPMEAWRREL